MPRPTRRGTPAPTHPATSRPRSLFMTDGNPKRRAAPARLGAPIALLALAAGLAGCAVGPNYVKPDSQVAPQRSEEHTSELQSRLHLVCRLLLEKKNEFVNVRIRPHAYDSHII